MKYEEIRSLLKNYIMNTYDIRPSLAEKTVEEMFKKCVDFISIEEQKNNVNIDYFKVGNYKTVSA